MTNLLKRTISGLVFAVLMLFAFLSDKVLELCGVSFEMAQFCSKLIYGAVFLFAVVVMMLEFLKMTCGDICRSSKILAILSGATLFTLVYLYTGFALPGKYIILAFVPLFVLMISSLYVKEKSHFDKYASLYTSVLYIAVPWSLLNFAVFNPATGGFSGMLLLSFFCIIWGSDVGAYCFGMALGQKYGKKLCPAISPKKSWIGFWGGMLVAVCVALALYFTGLFQLNGQSETINIIHCIVIAILMDVSGVYGDLIESQWKRNCEVKDSGTLIPGHGGLMDRFDSALIAIPLAIIYLVLIDGLFC